MAALTKKDAKRVQSLTRTKPEYFPGAWGILVDEHVCCWEVDEF